MKPALIFLALTVFPGSTFGQSFSCRIGQDAACLEWGDTVCSSGGKCVSDSAACFDTYQCDYQGFACKSEVQDCVAAHDQLASDYNSLLQDFETLKRDVRGLESARDDAETCLLFAATLEEAKACLN